MYAVQRGSSQRDRRLRQRLEARRVSLPARPLERPHPLELGLARAVREAGDPA